MRSGYQVIDCSKLTAFNGTQTVKGAFKKAKAGRPILLNNFNGMSVFVTDTSTSATSAILPTFAVVSGTLKAAKITISDEDAFTLAAL